VDTQNGQNTHWKKGFYTIAAGQAVSYIGSSAVQFALIWWLTKETGSALMLSLAGLFAYLPQTILALFAGVWIDRLKRKTVMIAADLFTGFVALAFTAAFFLGSPPH
jgi:DHA3 family macrolide efflux protein-like MFS transporter